MKIHLKEDFYYCTSTFMRKENPLRIFRLQNIAEEPMYDPDTGAQNGVREYFYPMHDEVFITDNHLDDNGNVEISAPLNEFRLATYGEIRKYIKYVYKNVSYEIKFYNNSKIKKEFFKEIEKTFKKLDIFPDLLGELEKFPRQEIYHNTERTLLQLFRSYYKCRIKKV